MQRFSEIHFKKFKNFIYQSYGIYLSDLKKDTLRLKINSCMSIENIESYDDYYNLLTKDNTGHYTSAFINAITINKTDFFREINHFNYIRNNISLIKSKNTRILKNNEIRVWSMACSTGQEPYSIAMTLDDVFGSCIKIKILATDINTEVLKTAIAGVYNSNEISNVPPQFLKKHFVQSGNNYEVSDKIKEMVVFRQFNLMNPFPFNGLFDIVFCRNVMIYFDSNVQQQILSKLSKCMALGGLLLIGHSESLINKIHSFQYAEPTVFYQTNR